MSHSRVWVVAALATFLGLGATCPKPPPEVMQTGDERLDEASAGETPTPSADAGRCSADRRGNVVLLDAKTAAPLSCVLAKVWREDTACPEGSTCDPVQLFRGDTNLVGEAQVKANPETDRLSAIAEGYVTSYRDPYPPAANRPAEIEMIPADGFTLKVLDAQGNYLPGISVVFKANGEPVAQLRTNVLSNVYFPNRTPFAGETITADAEGFSPATINGPEDLGADGHTLTLRR